MALSEAQLTDVIRSVGVAVKNKLTPFNDAANLGSHIFGKLIGTEAQPEYWGRGTNIVEKVQFNDVGTARNIGIAEDETWTRVDNVQDLSFYNRKTEAHYVMLADELIKVGVGTPDFDAQKFLDIKKTREQAAITSCINLIDRSLAAPPDPVTMEGALTTTAKAQASLFVPLNEWANGLPANTPSGTAYTTKAGISPTAVDVTPNYTPVQTTYGSATLSTFGTILQALSSAQRKTSYPRPTTFAEYYASEMRKWMILTSDMGIRAFEHLQLQGQHQWEKFGEGAVMDSTYHGVPLTYWPQMDTAAVYTDGSTGLAPESTADIKGPRYMGLPGDLIHPWINPERFWYYDEVFRNTPSQPDQYVFRLQIWWNLKWKSLRRGFFVSPSADLYY